MKARFRNSPRALTLLAPALVALATVLGLPATAAGHQFDHAPPAFTVGVPSTLFSAGGPGATWELIKTFPTGNPHTDLDFFTKRGETYASVGALAVGPNGGGQTIVKLTQGGEVTPTSPEFVSTHPSAACPSDPSAATGLQHDVESTPKGNTILNTFNSAADRRDAQLLIDATDNEGRCHDAIAFGGDPASPQGGLEIVDITNVFDPVEIGLTSHIGEAHTVNIDPKRPHIAYAVTSDFITGVTCNPDDTDCDRPDEDGNPSTNQGFNLDGFEVVDLSSCMNFPTWTSVEVKRMVCRPQVYRYRYPSALTGLGHKYDSLAGCHELEIYPDDTLTCAGVNATMFFDMSGAFRSNGRPRGTPLPCQVRESATLDLLYGTGAMVTDCVTGQGGQDLRIEGWNSIGAPSLRGVRFLGAAYHQGRKGNDPPERLATQDVEISHEAELSGSRRLILTTDERGGGVIPPGAACDPLVDITAGNGGIHAYRVNRLLSSTPSGPDADAAAAADSSYALTPSGGKAIFRTPIETGPQASLCDSHVFHQIPGQNRIFMGWYSQGTQVVDFVEHADGRVSFSRAGFFIPANANTWVSAVFKVRRNHNGTFTYWGATGDFNLGLAGRSAIDIYKVTLPAPPRPLGNGGEEAPPGCEDDDDDDVDFHMHGPLSASRGSNVEYTLMYSNLSADDDVECPEIEDLLDDDEDFVSATNGGVYDPETRTVTWSLGRLAPGATGSIGLTARISPDAGIGTALVNLSLLLEPGMISIPAQWQTIVLP